MIKNICKDIEFLKLKGTDLTKDELYVVDDLVDTLRFNLKRCVGMAANMIGYSKNAIVFVDEKENIVSMINPVILKKEGEYKANEGCLSLDGTRDTIRFKKIKVQYLDRDFKIKIKTFKDFTAQIIQHEIDHLFGIII